MKIFKTVCMVFLSVLILSTILGVNSCVDNNGTVIKTQAELENAFNKGGTYIIAKDITVNKTLTVKNGNYVQLKCTDSYGSHTITSTFDPEWTNDPAISVEKGATLKLGLGSATLNLSIPHDIILNIGTLYVYEYAFLHGSYNVIENYGELEMDGGKINGLVCNRYKGSFVMNGGEIFDSHPEGAGVFNDGTKFTMNGGEIYNSFYGVRNGAGGIFNMYGGKIHGNSGNGVSNNSAGDGPDGQTERAIFTMEGGEIYGNKFGVYTGGIFNWTGGTIHDNSAANVVYYTP